MNPPRDGLNPSIKHPPHSMEAEQSVLGGLMLNNRAWDEVSSIIRADDFYTHDHRVIFYAIGDLLSENTPCDFVTLSEKLREQGNLDGAGGVAYLGTLAADTGSASNVAAWAEIINARSVMRQLIAVGQDIAELGYQAGEREPSTLVNQAVQLVASIQNQRLGRATSQKFTGLAQESLELFKAEGALRRAGKIIGACTGLLEFDRITGGFHGPRLILLAARPKCGKTALLNSMALHTAKAGLGGYVCSIEMGGPETVARILSREARANVTRIMRGEPEEIRRAEDATGRIGDLPLWMDFETNRLDAICAQIALHRQQHGIEWAAVDHIGLVSTAEKFNTTNDKIGHISQTLKRLAKRLGIPIIALSQLGRSCDLHGGRKPLASDLRDSGNLEQDADMVVMLHVAQDERLKLQRKVEIGITANRAGPSLWCKTNYSFDGAFQQFVEGAVEEVESNSSVNSRMIEYGSFPPAKRHWNDD